jgi:uncharacterized Zn finger protein (UPF0148 family)
MDSSKMESSNQMAGEPKHTPGHSTEAMKTNNGQFMCPECGKTFATKETADRHLQEMHEEHLRRFHMETMPRT